MRSWGISYNAIRLFYFTSLKDKQLTELSTASDWSPSAKSGLSQQQKDLALNSHIIYSAHTKTFKTLKKTLSILVKNPGNPKKIQSLLKSFWTIPFVFCCSKNTCTLMLSKRLLFSMACQLFLTLEENKNKNCEGESRWNAQRSCAKFEPSEFLAWTLNIHAGAWGPRRALLLHFNNTNCLMNAKILDGVDWCIAANS